MVNVRFFLFVVRKAGSFEARQIRPKYRVTSSRRFNANARIGCKVFKCSKYFRLADTHVLGEEVTVTERIQVIEFVLSRNVGDLVFVQGQQSQHLVACSIGHRHLPHHLRGRQIRRCQRKIAAETTEIIANQAIHTPVLAVEGHATGKTMSFIEVLVIRRIETAEINPEVAKQ